ncbi:hypothetical protein [Pseudomonas sp. LB3P31]
MDFTELNTIDDQLRLYATEPGALKKRLFVESGSYGQGGIFKKSDISDMD